jgi:hypothetical protein
MSEVINTIVLVFALTFPAGREESGLGISNLGLPEIDPIKPYSVSESRRPGKPGSIIDTNAGFVYIAFHGTRAQA